MKQLLLLLIAACIALHGKDDVYIGIGPYMQTQPYEDADPVALASPVIFFDNSLFYIRWTRVGMYILGDKDSDFSWGISLTAQPQIIGYYETDAFNSINSRKPTPILQGMDERLDSWEAGVAFSVEYHSIFSELLVLYDILDRYNAFKIRAEFGKSYTYKNWYFIPSILGIYYSEKFTDYYFGVKEDEADPSIGRSHYSPNAAFNLAAQAYLKYDIGEHWHLLGNARADYFASEISDSPLVDKKYMLSGMISVLYSFNLFSEEKAMLNLPE